MTCRPLLPLLVLGAPLTAAQGQDSVLLRFAPVYDVPVHRLFQSHVRLVMPDAAGGSAVRTRETVDMGGIMQVVLPGPNGDPVVHLAFDSLRSRMREGGAPWREFTWAGLDTLWVQAWPAADLAIQRTEGDRSPAAAILVHLLAGVPDLTLPARWVRQGEQWLRMLDVPLHGVMVRGAGPLPDESVLARTDVRVDSIVARRSDTLAYVSLGGVFAPQRSAAEPGVRYDGTVSGSLIWSTGWSGWVSGATRVAVRARLRGRREGSVDEDEITVLLEATTRHQAQPSP